MSSILQWFEPPQSGELWDFSWAHTRPRHHHPETEFNVVVAGTGTFSIGSQTYDVPMDPRARPGDTVILCFPRMVEHELAAASPDFSMWVAYAPPASSALDELDLRAAWEKFVRPGARRITGEAGLALQDLCRSASGDASLARRRSLFLSIGLAYHSASPLEQSPHHPVARRALEILEERPELSRSELAASVALSEGELSRLVHREVGVPLVTHRNRLRVARYLEERRASTPQLDAALRAGFGSSASLHRTFAVETQCSPGAYLSGGAAALTRILRPLPRLGSGST